MGIYVATCRSTRHEPIDEAKTTALTPTIRRISRLPSQRLATTACLCSPDGRSQSARVLAGQVVTVDDDDQAIAIDLEGPGPPGSSAAQGIVLDCRSLKVRLAVASYEDAIAEPWRYRRR